MGKIKREVKGYEIKNALRLAFRYHIKPALQESQPSEKKVWAIECDDWYRAYNKFPWEGWFKYDLPKWRKFRHYRTREARDRALKDLQKNYRWTCKFRIPEREEAGQQTKQRLFEAEGFICRYLKKLMGENNG
jgi:hypothetical protein